MNDRTGATGLDVTRRGAIGQITLARPDQLNALDRRTLEGLSDAARDFDADETVKVVVISGAGRAFSAGFDLHDERWRELGAPERSAEVGRAMAEAISSMRAITVASVHGHCIGGGVVLAAACDLRLAAESASFRIPEVDLGVPLYWAGIPLLTRELGPAATKELVLTGRPFDAAEAWRLGFVNRVVGDDELRGATADLAEALAAKSALVLRTTKVQVDTAVPPIDDHDLGVADEVAGMATAFADPESVRLAAAYLARLSGRSAR